MAGDWIKVEKATPAKAEILQIGRILKVHRLQALGLCIEFWCWCDTQMVNGHADGVTANDLDEMFNQIGLSKALVKVGWLKLKGSDVIIPNFENHLGESAKKRALAARRKQKERNADPVVTSRSQRDKNVTREEKSREENNNHHQLIHDDADSQFDPSKPDPAIAAKLKHDSKVIKDAWHVACLFINLNSERRTSETIAKIVCRFADCISVHGRDAAVKLKDYYSLKDPAVWQAEVDSGKRLAIAASPLDVCNRFFPKPNNRHAASQLPSKQRLPDRTQQRIDAETEGIALLNSGKTIEEVMAILQERHDSEAAHAARSEVNKHFKGKH